MLEQQGCLGSLIFRSIGMESHDIKQILHDWREWGLCEKAPGFHRLLPISGGLTNRCWLLHLDSGDFVIRVSAVNTDALHIDRECEYRVQQRAARYQLAPAVRYRSRHDRYWIMEHVRGRQLAGPPPDDDLPELAEALKVLHRMPWGPDLRQLRVDEAASYYWDMIIRNFPDDCWSLKNELQTALAPPPGSEQCVCHMDPNPNNWLKSRTGWKLLDWEYAAIGHPYWDLANFVLMGELPPASHDRWLSLHGIDASSLSWRRAWLQMQYLNELWYGAQQMRTARALDNALTRLCDAVRVLLTDEAEL